MRSPVSAAHLQLRLAETLDARGEREAAELELAAAQATFEKIGAPALVEKCRAMRNGW